MPPFSIPGGDAAGRAWWTVFDPRESLRARAALLLGGAMLGLTALVTWLGGAVLQRELERTTGERFEMQAYQIADKLDRAIYERVRDLEFTAALPTFRTAPAAEQRSTLDALLDATPDFAWLGVANTEGTVVAATQRLFENTEVSARSWFQRGLEQPFVGSVRDFAELAREISASETDASRFLDVAVPIHDADGKPVGVLGAQVRWSWARAVQLSVVPEAAQRLHIGATLYAANGDSLLDSGGTGWTEPPAMPAIADRRQSRGVLHERTVDGSNYLTGYAITRGYREYRGLSWLVTVRQPTGDVFAPAITFRRTIAGWGLLLAIALGGWSWLVAGRITRRLRGVALAADRIRQGDILTILPSDASNRELAQMCHSLRALIEQLREQTTTLAAENDRLTAQLRGRELSSGQILSVNERAAAEKSPPRVV